MIKSFFGTKEWRLWAWGGTFMLLLLVWTKVQLSVQFNEWYSRFYTILQKAEDIDAFWKELATFGYLATFWVGIGVFVYYFTQHYAFRWRQAMTYYYLPHWESTDGNIEGASQRIQEDTYSFARSLETLGLGMFKALLTLIAFIPILWGLSEKITIPWLASIQGSLVWIALITSLGGMLMSYFVGIKLPGIEYDNQKVEASYRKQLVYSEDDVVYRELPTLYGLFGELRKNYFRMFNHYSYFTLWGSIYGQTMIILPYLLMGPSLFVGVITLGILIQTKNAFSEVNSSFSYLIDNWTDITKFISVIKRLKEFEGHLIPDTK